MKRQKLVFSIIALALIGGTALLLAAVPLLAASLLILFGRQVETVVMGWLRVDPMWTPLAWVWELLSRITQYVVAFGTTATVSALLYFYGPYRKQRWRYVWPGAILATLLWLGATSAFAWYAVHIAHYNVMYGSVSASIALLVWMYVLAIVALIGCEFNAEYERASMLR